MALDPVVAKGMDALQPQQLVPKVRVQGGLFVAFHPALGLPALSPALGKAVDHIFRVAPKLHDARLLQERQRPDHGGQFHAVVGGIGFPAGKLPLVGTVYQNGSPAAGSGIAGTSAIGINSDLFHLKHPLRFFMLSYHGFWHFTRRLF